MKTMLTTKLLLTLRRTLTTSLIAVFALESVSALAQQSSSASPSPKQATQSTQLQAARMLAAQKSKAGEETSTETVAGKEESRGKDGSIQQGLKVHGHWVIDVSNPDGKQVQHHEFENSLYPGAGSFVLSELLTFQAVPGGWGIRLGPGVDSLDMPIGPGPCTGSSHYCDMQFGNMTSSPGTGGKSYCSTDFCGGTLESPIGMFSSSFVGFQLSGSITANATGSIGNVQTILGTCLANVKILPGGFTNSNNIATTDPWGCSSNEAFASPTPPPVVSIAGPFTDATITPISIVAGQIIKVVVTISFS